MDPSLPNPQPRPTKLALVLAYNGHGYKGMQRNPGARTIESDLLTSLLLSSAAPNPHPYDFSRCARTDKGVSSAFNLVSATFLVHHPPEVLLLRLNSHLPPQIRVLGVEPVSRGFDAKKSCEGRRYVYLLPVFALDWAVHRCRESGVGRCLECSERGRKVAGVIGRRVRKGGEVERLGLDLENGGFDEKRDVILENGRSHLCNGSVSCDGEVDGRQSLYDNERLKCGSGSGNGVCKLKGRNGSAVESLGKLECRVGFRAAKDSNVTTCVCKSRVTDGSLVKSLDELEIGVGFRELQDGHVSFRSPPDGVNRESDSANCVDAQMGMSSKFRYGEIEKERFNGILKHYVGRHNFHNLTTRMKADDPAAWRHIISFEANTMICIDGIEFVKCEVFGKSFMLHQIRKMIGLAVAIMRDCASESLMDLALREEVNINVPTAPEVGLFLDQCLFSSYNQKQEGLHKELSVKAFAEKVENFKQKHIYPHIASREKEDGAVALWLHSLNSRNYPDFLLRPAEHLKS